MRDRRSRVVCSLLSACALLLIAATTVLAPTASAQNDQEGNNSGDANQRGDADTGDSVGGQDIGVTGGRVTISATNSSNRVRTRTGDADADNSSDSFTGQRAAEVDGTNEQDGDNNFDLNQSADASTGDGVGGQVIGVAASHFTSITATNVSERVDVVTGDADSSNDAGVIVGLVSAANVQEGDNDSDIFQSADSSSGDGVAGQLIGVVGRNGGSADIALSNITRSIDVTSGDDDESSSADSFVGLATGPIEL